MIKQDMMPTPRTMFAIKRQEREMFVSELMLLLTADKLADIKSHFHDADKTPRLLNLHQFVKVFLDCVPEFVDKQHLRQSEHSNTTTVESYARSLNELFDAIDTNGDKCVDWNEFAQYIVAKAKDTDSLLTLKDHNRYEVIPPVRHMGPLHRNSICKMQYLPSFRMLAALESNSSSISFYNATSCKWQANLSIHGRIPLTFEYIPGKENLVLPCADKSIVIYQLNPAAFDRSSVKYSWSTSQMHISAASVPKHDLLYTGSVSGTVHAWNMEQQAQKEVLTGHADAVSCIHNMEILDNLVTGSLDSSIYIWDIFTGVRRQELKGHKRGIVALSHNASYRLLISAATENQALVWSPFVPSILHTLPGHKHPLIGAQCIPDSTQIVTADCSGLVKVWDIRNFSCLQTFSREEPVRDLVSIETYSHGAEKRIACATKDLFFFKTGKAMTDPTSSAFPIRFMVYNSKFLSILTISGTKATVWDVVMGSPISTFQHLMPSDITALAMDGLERRFFLGDAHGNIRGFNYQTGAMIKEYDRHAEEIVSICYSHENKALVTASRDNRIHVHNDFSGEDEDSLMRAMDPSHKHTAHITCLDICSVGTVVVSGATDQKLKMWDFDTGKLSSEFLLDSSPCVIQCLASYRAVAVATEAGLIEIFSIEGCIHGCQRLFSFCHGTRDPKTIYPLHVVFPELKEPIDVKMNDKDRLPYSDEGCPAPESPVIHSEGGQVATALHWDSRNYTFLSASEWGVLHCWNFRRAFDQLKLVRVKESDVNHRQSFQYSRRGSLIRAKTSIVPCLASEMIVHDWSRQAHSNTISRIVYMRNLSSIATGSCDRCVTAWTMHGGRVGTLLQEIPQGGRNHDWDMHIDIGFLKAEEDSTSMELIAKVRDARLKSTNVSELISAVAPRLPSQSVKPCNESKADRMARISRKLRAHRLMLSLLAQSRKPAGGGGGLIELQRVHSKHDELVKNMDKVIPSQQEIPSLPQTPPLRKTSSVTSAEKIETLERTRTFCLAAGERLSAAVVVDTFELEEMYRQVKGEKEREEKMRNLPTLKRKPVRKSANRLAKALDMVEKDVKNSTGRHFRQLDKKY